MKELNTKIAIKKVGSIGEIQTVANTLKSYQDIVGGYIETYPLGKDLILVLNEEGKLMDLDVNFAIPYKSGYTEYIVGDVAIVNSDEEGNFASLNDEQIEYLKEIGMIG
ncbi:MAG: DUF3846 domain-containing protein [Clostridium sp.]|nr:DUF3846 domain-containing protein [Clostridium sp.]